jgi:large subunit ribosomal protein L18
MRGSRTAARRRRHLRVRRKVHGTAARPRLTVFRSNKYIYAQVIDDDAGHTLAAASSQEAGLRERSLDTGTAAEVGKLIAARTKDRGVSRVVFDRGGFAFHGRIRALAESAREEGLEF